MNLVWYDTETTGTSTAFDQILQIAAIRTDAELKELDRFELRCRLHPHVVPHPAALHVTGMDIGRVTDPSLPCHYDMMREVQRRFAAWSPAIFVGYNSLSFDEHLLRQALFKTLHPPYLTNTGGNRRADALALVQAAAVFAPECLRVPLGDSGRPSFKLDCLAPANGFDHGNAHDALADVEATIHLARCVRAHAPACWNRLVRFSAKREVEDFLAEEDAFLLTEFYYNRPFNMVVAAFGSEPQGGPTLCLNLNVDLDWVASLPDDQLAKWVGRSPKPVRRIRSNAAPSLAPLDEVSPGLLGPLSADEARRRGRRVRADASLRRRLMAAIATDATEWPASEHVEEQIYSGFIPNRDLARMLRFHEADWPTRTAIVEELEDPRLRYHGRRLVHELHPALLEPRHRSEIEEHVRGRLGADGPAKWTTVHAARTAADEMEASHGPLPALRGFREYLEAGVGGGGAGGLRNAH